MALKVQGHDQTKSAVWSSTVGEYSLVQWICIIIVILRGVWTLALISEVCNCKLILHKILAWLFNCSYELFLNKYIKCVNITDLCFLFLHWKIFHWSFWGKMSRSVIGLFRWQYASILGEILFEMHGFSKRGAVFKLTLCHLVPQTIGSSSYYRRWA